MERILDGNLGNTYLTESAPDDVDMFVGGNRVLHMVPGFLETLPGVSLGISPGEKLNLGQISRTYITGTSSPDSISIVVTDQETVRFNQYGDSSFKGNLLVDPSKGVFFDGAGGNDFIAVDPNNQLRFVAGGILAMTIAGVGGVPSVSLASGTDLYMATGGKINFTGPKNYITGTDLPRTVKIFVNGEENARFEEAGRVFFPGVPSGSASTANLTAGGELVKETSSIRFKENIADLEIDSSLIYDLRPVSFDFKVNEEREDDGDLTEGEIKNQQRQFGLIAEEVEEILPELVFYDAEGEPDSVFYERVSILLLAEMKKMKSRVDELEDLVGELQEELGTKDNKKDKESEPAGE